MDWSDAHAGSVQAVATLVLVVITAYYAYVSGALVRETRTTLRASTRATLQERMDRLNEILIREANLFDLLNDANASGAERDARSHIANILMAILEEAYTQRMIERTLPEDDWRAWVATAGRASRSTLLGRLLFHGILVGSRVRWELGPDLSRE